MYTSYAYYVIWFSDQAEYNAAVATAGGNGFGHCPVTAAAAFGIAWPLVGGGPITGTKGIYGFLPYGIPASPGAGIEINHPQASGSFLKSNIDNVIVPGQVGNPPVPVGESMSLVWWGTIVYSPNVVAGLPPATPIPPRRWITGFENGGTYPDGLVDYTAGNSRVGSRTTDGFGYVIRGNASNGFGKKTITDYLPAYHPTTSWERFYIRINNLGTNELSFWYASGNTAGGASIRIDFLTGSLRVYNATSSALDGTLMGTTVSLTLGKWYLVDVLLKWATAVGDVGQVRLYLNHSLSINATINDGLGMDGVGYHVSTTIGQQSVVETGWDVDLDDWICADVPNNGGVESLDSLDWITGSHVRLCNVESAVFTNWGVGGKEQLYGGINPEGRDGQNCLTNVNLATIEATTTGVTHDEQVTPGIILGAIAALPQTNLFAGNNSIGRIGYSLAGGAYTYKTLSADGAAWLWREYLYSQSGQPLPINMTPFKMIRENGNDAFNKSLMAFNVCIEYIGIWGLEDNSLFPLDISNNVWYHNARYANILHGLMPYAGVPDSPVYAVGGTFIGNTSGQTINLPAPAHYIFIRPLTVGNFGVEWFGSNMSGHKGGQGQYIGNLLPRCWVDNTGQAKFSVAGNGNESNSNLVVYQYIAFCDPGMRFEYCNAYNIRGALATKTLSLFDPTFIPQAAFVQKEYNSDTGAVILLNYKGTGSAGNTGVNIAGVPLANFGSFGAGSLVLKADNIGTWYGQNNYALWRTTDNNGNVAVQITNYTGNGLATRIINFPIATGRYPLFVIVIPNNSQPGFVRDPSHAGNNSTDITSLAITSATAIMDGGLDHIHVGITLNGNGVVYEVFAIMGDVAGWNNGTFYPPSYNASGPWILPPYTSSDLPIMTGAGGINLNSSASLFMIQNLSGLYTLVTNKLTDTVYTGFAAATEEVKIPDPEFKTGYIGG